MIKKILLLLILFLINFSLFADDTYIDGHKFNEEEVLGFYGMAQPSLSATNTARIYFDSTAHRLKISENAAAYTNLLSVASADTLYLKLDTSNDPLTGTLTVTGTVAATLFSGSGASLTNIDISSGTNLSGDAENVLTGDALSIGAGITRDTEWDTITEINTATTDADIIATNSSWSGGDLGGTGLAATVTDDSHNHTTTTISGLDISADTNLTAGDHITLTDDDLDVDDDFLLNNGDIGSGTYNFTGNVSTLGNIGIGNTNPLFPLHVSTNSLIVTSGANVGIGTTNPTSKLYVNGDANITGDLYVTDVFVTNIDGDSYVLGNLGIGTTAPSAQLEVTKDTIKVAGNIVDFSDPTDNDVLTFDAATQTWAGEAGGAGSGDITSVGDVASGAAFDGTQGTTLTFNNAGGDGVFFYNGEFSFDKNVGIGTTNPTCALDVVGTLEADTITEGGNAVYNSTETPGGELGGTWASPTIDDSIGVSSWALTSSTALDTFLCYSDDDTPTTTFILGLRKARDGNPTDDVSAEDYLGIMRFEGYHTDGYDEGAIIRSIVDTTPGNGDMPARLEFLTTPDASATPLTRLTIKNNGNVGVGTTNPVYNLMVEGTLQADDYYSGDLTQGADAVTGGLTFKDGLYTSGTLSGATTALNNLASVAINESLISDTANTDDIGSPTKTWKDGYFAGNVGIGTTALTSKLNIGGGAINTGGNIILNSNYLSGDGDNEGILIDSTGRVTQPAQPCFSVTNTAEQTNIAEGTAVTVLWNSERFDVGSNFASNTFTAPITGKYWLSVYIWFTQVDTAATYYETSIITSNKTYYISFYPGTELTADGNKPITFSVLADMDAADTAYITVYQQASGVVQTDLVEAGFFIGSLIN